MSRLYGANNCWLSSGVDDTDTWRPQPSVFWREITVLQYSASTYFWETFVYDKDWNSSRKQTPDVALTGLLSGVFFLTGHLKSILISRKVWYSLDMRKLICIHLHHIIWFRKLRLKFAALIRKCESVESGCMVWKTLPINLFWWGSQLLGTTWAAATRVLSQSKTENPGNEVGNEVVLVRSADWIKDKSYFTALTLQGVADLYLYG